MTDTTVPVVAVNALSTLTTGVGVVIFGVHTGLDYPTLIAGVIGGATALSYLAPSKLLNRAFEIITAALLAGYSSPVLAQLLTYWLGKFDLVDKAAATPMALQLSVAFAVGYLAHGVLLPGLRKVGSVLMRRAANE